MSQTSDFDPFARFFDMDAASAPPGDPVYQLDDGPGPSMSQQTVLDLFTSDIVSQYRPSSEYRSFANSFNFSQLSLPYTAGTSSSSQLSTFLPQDDTVAPAQFVTPAQLTAPTQFPMPTQFPNLAQFPNIYGSPMHNNKSAPNISRRTGSLPVGQGARSSFENIKLPSLLTSAMPTPEPTLMPIYSIHSSTHHATSSQTGLSDTDANQEIALEPGPSDGNIIPLKNPSVLSMIRLEQKCPAWHLVTSGARDLHRVQSFNNPGRMWPDPISNALNAAEALLEMRNWYVSNHTRLRLPQLERTYKLTSEPILTLASDILVATAIYDTRRVFRKAGIAVAKLSKDPNNFKEFRPNSNNSPSYSELRDDYNFMHDGRLDNNGNVIPNYLQGLNKTIIYNSCYAGVVKEGRSHSFVLGLKHFLTQFNIPSTGFTFFNTIPDDAWGLSNASLLASIDDVSTGCFVKKKFKGPYALFFKDFPDGLQAAKQDPDFAQNWEDANTHLATSWTSKKKKKKT